MGCVEVETGLLGCYLEGDFFLLLGEEEDFLGF